MYINTVEHMYIACSEVHLSPYNTGSWHIINCSCIVSNLAIVLRSMYLIFQAAVQCCHVIEVSYNLSCIHSTKDNLPHMLLFPNKHIHTYLHGLLCPWASVVGHLDPVRPTRGRPSAVIAPDLQYLLTWVTSRGCRSPNQWQQPAVCMCCNWHCTTCTLVLSTVCVHHLCYIHSIVIECMVLT